MKPPSSDSSGDEAIEYGRSAPVRSDHDGLPGAVRECRAVQVEPDDARPRRGGHDLANRQRQEHRALCYQQQTMAIMRRARGAMLRLVRRRTAGDDVGSALIAPAAWVEFRGRDVPWWAEGLALIVGATGIALFWTGLTGGSPDWVE